LKKVVTPYKDSSEGKKEQVTAMFDNIAPKYDVLNRIMSMGIDITWRNKVDKMLHKHAVSNILDIATGTGDLAITLHREGVKITGMDISQGMMDVGVVKVKEKGKEKDISFTLGDAENIPFPDNHFDAITVAFGVRNFENLQKGLKDMYRVLKPGGHVYILELSTPTKTPYKQLYKIYSTQVMPRIGRLISKDTSAYTYLPESIAAFPYGKEFTDIMEKCQYTSVSCRPLTFGLASIYSGTKQ
jgi:demethylmenaquinone methyltransferase/2-methoxy-6-polyprenyl-1,4-benzoquinol methylase